MQYANILLALGGDTGTTVPKDEVSASEIAVLRLIHGEAAVTEIEPVEVDEAKAKRTSREEIGRLRELYGRARVTSEDGNDISVVNVLFPGAAAQAIKSLEDLEIPEDFFKAKSRATASVGEEKPVKAAKKGGKKAEPKAEEPKKDDGEGNDTDEVFA